MQARLQGDVSHLAKEALRGAAAENGTNLSSAPQHLADQGTDNFEQEFSLSLLHNQEQVLTEIADALERIRQGTFGRCEECRAPSIRPACKPCPIPVIVSSVPGSSNKVPEHDQTRTIVSSAVLVPGPGGRGCGPGQQVWRV